MCHYISYRYYVPGLISYVIFMCLFRIVTSIIAGLMELYPNVILTAAILHTIAILLPILDYFVFYKIDYFTDDNEYCSGLAGCLWLIPCLVEASFRLSLIATIWVYYKEPTHSLFIVNVILSVIASTFGLAIIIYQAKTYYPIIKEKSEKMLEYDEI